LDGAEAREVRERVEDWVVMWKLGRMIVWRRGERGEQVRNGFYD